MTEVLLEDLLLTECAALDPRSVVGLLELEALELALLICSINTARTSSCKAELESKAVIRWRCGACCRVETAKYRSQEAKSSE